MQNALSNPAQVSGQQWRDNTGGAVSPLGWNDFTQAALQSVPPQQCAQTQVIGPGAFLVSNTCPIPIVIVSMQSGPMTLPCDGPVCYFPAGNQHVVNGPLVFQGVMNYQFMQ